MYSEYREHAITELTRERSHAMTSLLLLVLCALTPSALAGCSVQTAQPQFQRATYEFAMELTTRVAQEKNNHFVASTFSIWALLATASLGAAGPTLDEFRKVLGLHRNQCFNDQYFELARSTTGGNVTVEKISSIFAADRLMVKDGFLRRARDAGTGEVVVMSFEDPETVASTIDQLVSRATHGKITDLVTSADLKDIDLVLIDALYFKGLWQTPFPHKLTKRKPFYDDAGVRVGEVEMMWVKDLFNLSVGSVPGARVLELPFGTDRRFAMLVFLPDTKTTLTAVIDSLSRVSLSTIYTEFAHDYEERVIVELPRFELTSKLDNLHELLRDMGLRAAFDRKAAEFPLLSDVKLYISNVMQKATLTVSETGAEASAATAGLLMYMSMPPVFRVNKPFLYMIVDTVTQVPLFTGAYSQPS